MTAPFLDQPPGLPTAPVPARPATEGPPSTVWRGPGGPPRSRRDVRVVHLAEDDAAVLADTTALAQRGRAVVVVLERPRPATIRHLFTAGIRGFVDARSGRAGVVAAVGAVSTGRPWLDPQITGALAAALQSTRPIPGLTRRQSEVLRLCAEGSSTTEIAAQLGIEESTVKSHVNALLERLGARTRVEAIRIARRRGWL
jgi:two-component system, NarL family, response regulator DesR